MVDITRAHLMNIALDVGIMFHSGYGQQTDKRMPVSDVATIETFAQRLLEFYRKEVDLADTFPPKDFAADSSQNVEYH